MKIVHLEEFFHPQAGYQVNLLARIQAAQGESVSIVTGELRRFPEFVTKFFGSDDMETKDEEYRRETGVRIRRVPLLGYYSGRAIFRPWKLRSVIRAEQPDVLFVHGEDTLTGIVAIWLSPVLRFPLFLDCHMVEMASAHRFRKFFRFFYRKAVTPVILRRQIPLVRVVDSDYVDKCLGVPLDRTELLPLGTDTSLFAPDIQRRRRTRERLQISDEEFVVIYAGKLDESKGGTLLASAIEDLFHTQSHQSVTFLIVGTASGPEAEDVELRFDRSKNRVIRLPTQPYTELPDLYRAADVAVFPKQCSLSFFDAQASGLPVALEDNEINRQRIHHGNALTFHTGDQTALRGAIAAFASMDPAEIASRRSAAREFVLAGGFDFVPIAHRFTELLYDCRRLWEASRSSADS
jgi:glycosyltransferase involved in cell wall biosynthesis